MGKEKAFDAKNWHSYTAGDYLVAKNYNDYGDDEIRIIQLEQQQQKLLGKEVELRTKRNMIVGYSAGMPITVATGALPMVGAPFLLYGAAFAGSLAGMMGYAFKDEVRDAATRKKQRRTRNELIATAEHWSFKDRDIDFELPKDVLDTEVSFESEVGRVAIPAGTLVESFNGHFSGIHATSDEGDSTVTGSVNPYSLVFAATTYGRNIEGSVIAASREHLITMDQSQRKMPRFRPRQSQLLEGLRQEDEAAVKPLLLSALGVYGVLRAQMGEQVSRLMADLYVERGSEGIMHDAERLISPTTENMSWDQIHTSHTYLTSLARERE